VFICVTVICLLFCVCVYFIFFVLFAFAAFSFSTLILLVGFLTCKNRLPYNLYCVGGDVKHCSINQSINRRPRGRLFQIRGPTAPKLLSPKLLCVRGTAIVCYSLADWQPV